MSDNSLSAVCETFKEHLASVVADLLHSADFRKNLSKGLKGLPISRTQLNDLIGISDKPAVTTQDVDIIISKIMPRDPPAEFTNNYKAFATALAKYRAVSELQTQATDLVKFKKTFYIHQGIINNSSDGQTREFLKFLQPFLNIQDKFFQTHREQAEIYVPLQPDKRKFNKKN